MACGKGIQIYTVIRILSTLLMSVIIVKIGSSLMLTGIYNFWFAFFFFFFFFFTFLYMFPVFRFFLSLCSNIAFQAYK